MTLHIRGHERTPRHHAQALPLRVLQSGLGQLAADSLAFQVFRDLGMRESYLVTFPVILQERCVPVFLEREPVFCFLLDYLRLHAHGSGRKIDCAVSIREAREPRESPGNV